MPEDLRWRSRLESGQMGGSSFPTRGTSAAGVRGFWIGVLASRWAGSWNSSCTNSLKVGTSSPSVPHPETREDAEMAVEMAAVWQWERRCSGELKVVYCFYSMSMSPGPRRGLFLLAGDRAAWRAALEEWRVPAMPF